MKHKIEISGDWLKTQSGSYINLTQVVIFQKYHQHNKGYLVQAIFPSSCGADRDVLFETVGVFDTAEQAQEYMDEIIKEMNYGEWY